MYHVGIDASPPPIRYRSIMNDTIDTYLIPDRRFSLCRYLADTVTAPSGPIPFGYRGASVSASVSAMADTRYQHICICRARCEQTAKLSIPPKSGNNKYQLSISKGVLVSCHWRGAATERLDNGAYRRRSVSATCGPLSFLIRNAYVQIQIQIQIGSLHTCCTCLDETDAMTNTASVCHAAYVRSIIPTKTWYSPA
jgi:hypothetical protein